MINQWLNLGVTILFLWFLLVILLKDWEKLNAYFRSFIIILTMFSVFNLSSIWSELNTLSSYTDSLKNAEIVIYDQKHQSENDVTLQNKKALQKYIIEHFDDETAESILDNVTESYRGDTLPTKLNRPRFAFKPQTTEKLEWLVAQKQIKSKKKIYPCHILEELIDNEYTIRKAFRK